VTDGRSELTSRGLRCSTTPRRPAAPPGTTARPPPPAADRTGSTPQLGTDKTRYPPVAAKARGQPRQPQVGSTVPQGCGRRAAPRTRWRLTRPATRRGGQRADRECQRGQHRGPTRSESARSERPNRVPRRRIPIATPTRRASTRGAGQVRRRQGRSGVHGRTAVRRNRPHTRRRGRQEG